MSTVRLNPSFFWNNRNVRCVVRWMGVNIALTPRMAGKETFHYSERHFSWSSRVLWWSSTLSLVLIYHSQEPWPLVRNCPAFECDNVLCPCFRSVLYSASICHSKCELLFTSQGLKWWIPPSGSTESFDESIKAAANPISFSCCSVF